MKHWEAPCWLWKKGFIYLMFTICTSTVGLLLHNLECLIDNYSLPGECLTIGFKLCNRNLYVDFLWGNHRAMTPACPAALKLSVCLMLEFGSLKQIQQKESIFSWSEKGWDNPSKWFTFSSFDYFSIFPCNVKYFNSAAGFDSDASGCSN